ncbi:MULTISPECIES: flagellar basal-body rod protein FlgF [unclassified Neptuniibacter]|jgi:flagellar basal-body rod protein FlgF|uniref:flagellar basal-body rod protein FlgF n=1 Tax=unclassified Neptuniibacter TaxID=2630693 RepID=UPI0026E3E0E0|nr:MULTISPECIES: flagellar basal-body rod protein FlgF [unclassified Neptuniibacter]MDO6515443.1 flagellar basal-body rod protein FlgF [Neptuniibacter sp. 2_MG-2023]MDO6595094.1 flagellar basal-body rod protein FlgF [Neptuniibacter sp. 1_MG-2023]
MDKVLYLAMSGARENMLAQQSYANNLANANTTGFKSDLAQARAMQVFGEGYASRVYAQTERPATDMSSGSLIDTGRKLDVAIAGDGWLTVLKPDGTEGYTRAGSLQMNAANQLVTGSGLPVMGNGGIPIALPPFENIDIATNGIITIRPVGDNAVELLVADQLKLVNPDPKTLFKGTDGLMTTGAQAPLEADLNVRLRAGYLETSNVNAVSELTGIITSSRQFEMQIKMMKTAEENSEAATSILKLS